MKTLNVGRLSTTAVATLILTLAAGSGPLAAQEAAPARPQATPSQGPLLPLSIDQAVAMALEANLGLKAERLNVDVASHSVAIARAAFLPVVTAGTSRNSSKFVPQDFTQGTSADISTATFSASGTARQVLPWYGSSYSATWSSNRRTQQGGIAPFNPSLGSTLRVDFSQPLLRGFKTDTARVNLENAERRRAITDVQVQQRTVATEAAVKNAYLNLVGAIEGKKVNEQNLDIAQRSLSQSQSRVKVGQSPPIEIVQAEAQVASTRVGVIAAEAQIAAMEDNLRALILDPARPDYWQVKLVPTDTIQVTAKDIDIDGVIKNALANRLDLAVENRQLEITNLTIALNKNVMLPAVDVGANYTAQGTGGTQFEFGQGFPPPILSETHRSFGSVLGDTFGGAYPTWTVGVSVAYPIGRTAARAAYAQSLVSKRQEEIGIDQLKLQIVSQVRDAARQVQNTYEQVQAAKAAREASQRQLDAEERRFAVGISTNLELQVRQRDLAQAKIIELNSMLNYNRALILLERVQKIQ
jgi:outer membrane protein TolC